MGNGITTSPRLLVGEKESPGEFPGVSNEILSVLDV